MIIYRSPVDADYRGAEKMLLHLRHSGLNPEVYSYLIAMTVLVKEFNELAKALHELKVVQERG
ncbi:Pentatricopeptide repeat-containing protein, chloroplastic, partial [Cucurbita argyrosperma subsp. argyrosperma]